MRGNFRIKSLKVDGRAVPFGYMAFAKDYDGEMHMVYNLDTGVRNRFWRRIFTPDFHQLLRAANYPNVDDKEVEVEATLADADGGAADIPVRGRALRELIGIETRDRGGTNILACHSLQMLDAKKAAA